MSGIVGGAGSKSGVIGTTELDYEEGSWTPVPNTGSISSIVMSYYRKIGGICFLQTSLGNIQGGFGTLTGLPFSTIEHGAGYETASGNLMVNHVNMDDDTYQIAMYVYNNSIILYQSRDNQSWASVTEGMMENNDDMIMACSYFCPK